MDVFSCWFMSSYSRNVIRRIGRGKGERRKKKEEEWGKMRVAVLPPTVQKHMDRHIAPHKYPRDHLKIDR